MPGSLGQAGVAQNTGTHNYANQYAPATHNYAAGYAVNQDYMVSAAAAPVQEVSFTPVGNLVW